MNKLSSLIFLFLLTAVKLYSQTYSGPESVEYDYANSRWLISNTTSHQVLARDSNGVLTIFTTLTGTGPYGIEIVGDTLFCCNGASIKGFLLSNAQQVFNVNVGATFLNGITHDNSGNLVTTDFTGKAIYKVNIASLAVTPMISAMTTTPNGIIFDQANNRCVFVNWGSNAQVKAIDMTSNAISTLANTTLGNCDGIARDGGGNYYVSAWSSSSVVKFDSAFSGAPVTVASSLSNPADIFYNTVMDTLGIPNSQGNTVTFVGFSTVGIDEKENNLNYSITNNRLQIFSDMNLKSFSIYDMNGKLQMSGKIENDKSISLDNLSSGVFMLVVRNEVNYFARKFSHTY